MNKPNDNRPSFGGRANTPTEASALAAEARQERKVENEPQPPRTPDEAEICRQAGLHSANAVQWKGYSWREYQVAIVRQNHHISKLEQQRDALLAAVNSLLDALGEAESTTDTLDAIDDSLPALRAAIATAERRQS